MSTSISIESADDVALSAMLEHHAQLRGELESLVAALREAVAGSRPSSQAISAVLEFIAGSILPHAQAEEEALYPTAADEPVIALLVDAMVLEHRDLEQHGRALASSGTATQALAHAEGFAAVFSVHVAKENEVLLPALVKAADVSLATLLRDMEARLAETTPGHHHEPEVAPQPTGELDVRTLAHGSRHDIIFSRLHALADGERLVIVNDHDPKPLRYQLDAAWPGTFDWAYLQPGPQVWRIEITKRA